MVPTLQLYLTGRPQLFPYSVKCPLPMEQLLSAAAAFLPMPRSECRAGRAVVNEVNGRPRCVAVPAAALVVMPARPSTSTAASSDSSLMTLPSYHSHAVLLTRRRR